MDERLSQVMRDENLKKAILDWIVSRERFLELDRAKKDFYGCWAAMEKMDLAAGRIFVAISKAAHIREPG